MDAGPRPFRLGPILGPPEVLCHIPPSICIKSIPAVASGPPSGMFSPGASCPDYKSSIPDTLG